MPVGRNVHFSLPVTVSTPTIARDGEITVSVTLTNGGARDASEVVQLYIRRRSASVTQPVLELKGFQRLTLRPGESRTLSFTIPARQLAVWDDTLTETNPPGPLRLWAGNSSANLTPLEGQGLSAIVFAGAARIWTPLTHDMDSFRALLDEVDTDAVKTGGTDLAAALLPVVLTRLSAALDGSRAALARVGAGFGGTVLGLSGAVIGRTIGATLGQVIDQRLLGAGSEAVEVGRVERFRLTGASEGAAVTRAWGRVRLGGQVIWATQFSETVQRRRSGNWTGCPPPSR